MVLLSREYYHQDGRLTTSHASMLDTSVENFRRMAIEDCSSEATDQLLSSNGVNTATVP